MVTISKLLGFLIIIILVIYLFRIFTRDGFNTNRAASGPNNPEYSYCKSCRPPPCPVCPVCPKCPASNNKK